MTKLINGLRHMKNYMKVIINDEKLVDILKKREIVFKKIQEINEKLIELDTKRTKEGYKMEELKEKTKIIIDKLDVKLGEFEYISRVYLEEDKAYYEINDMIDVYRESIREERKSKEEEKKII
jgi:hypothetical protein